MTTGTYRYLIPCLAYSDIIAYHGHAGFQYQQFYGRCGVASLACRYILLMSVTDRIVLGLSEAPVRCQGINKRHYVLADTLRRKMTWNRSSYARQYNSKEPLHQDTWLTSVLCTSSPTAQMHTPAWGLPQNLFSSTLAI